MIACISSIWDRTELLEKALKSLYNQVDHIYVCLNNYEVVPDFLNDPKITWIRRKNKYGDAYKFYWVEKINGPVALCDDDIIYPPGYCDFMQNGLNKYGGVVSIQGRNFDKFPIFSYYHRATERTFCYYEQAMDVKVQFGGTGVMCFDTREVSPPMNYFKKKNMADIWMGLYCVENNISITSLAHPEAYVTPQECTGIWHEKNNKDWEQVKIINEFFRKT